MFLVRPHVVLVYVVQLCLEVTVASQAASSLEAANLIVLACRNYFTLCFVLSQAIVLHRFEWNISSPIQDAVVASGVRTLRLSTLSAFRENREPFEPILRKTNCDCTVTVQLDPIGRPEHSKCAPRQSSVDASRFCLLLMQLQR
jgi:hypothetical protein